MVVGKEAGAESSLGLDAEGAEGAEIGRTNVQLAFRPNSSARSFVFLRVSAPLRLVIVQGAGTVNVKNERLQTAFQA